MENCELVKHWLEEEKIAHIKGWDFSHLQGRYEEEDDLPWDYGEIVKSYIKPDSSLLDIDTGGGEFLLSLGHANNKVSATEGYPPNVQLCKETLLPLGIDFREADSKGILPFPDETFDVIINRHGNYDPSEIYRLLKPQGVFITQQVGAENDRELVELLLGNQVELPFPDQYLEIAKKRIEESGLDVTDSQEAFRPIRFWDVGALVWFAHIIEWEFPDFTVERCIENLFRAQKILDKKGVIEGTIHRYILIGKKKSFLKK